jgi:hypothetical protein
MSTEEPAPVEAEESEDLTAGVPVGEYPEEGTFGYTTDSRAEAEAKAAEGAAPEASPEPDEPTE